MPNFTESLRAGLVAAVCGGLVVGAGGSLVAADVSSQVTAHLAAGEFGPALDQAGQVADPALRSQLLDQISQAQFKAGDVGAARGTVRRIADPAVRAAAQARQATEASQAGGGADFTQLIALIMANTSGSWEAEDGTGGNMSPFMTGVRVAPQGVLERVSVADRKGTLSVTQEQARKADVNRDMSKQVPLRLVSLTRLEKEVAQRIAEGQPVPESMGRLAGLTRVTHVFVFGEEKEIVLGGPAEGWEFTGEGHAVGTHSRRPTLLLDDLVVVMRAFAAGNPDFGCSINTRDEGVKALTEYAQKSQQRGSLSPAAVKGWVNQLQKKLGRQDIVVWGVPADSRVARVIVEADYRMKLVGVDKLELAKDVPSYFDLLPKNQQGAGAVDALRWWLTMKCDAVVHSPDRSAFELQGSSVLCQSENQFLTADGKHHPTGKSEATNRQFAENFTEHYDELAQQDFAFADAQNVFDLALVAALIKQEGLPRQVGWDYGTFAPEGSFATASFPAPKEVDSVVNHRVYGGRDVVVQVAGGVRADIKGILTDPKLQQESARLDNLEQTARAPQLPAGRWWWDAKTE